jgi:hypothetical protein
MLFMVVNHHFLLGLAAEAEALNCRRKSFLMAATNFRVGTRFNCSRFSFSFIGGAL